jgi:hypothetical protein
LVGVNAQDVLTTEEMNSVYKKEKHHNKIVQKYAPLRQADVMWSRKIWREIDMRQKINHPFYYPENDGVGHTIVDRKSLIDVIYSAIQEGSITAYDNAAMDDEFREEMSQDAIKKIGHHEHAVTVQKLSRVHSRRKVQTIQKNQFHAKSRLMARIKQRAMKQVPAAGGASVATPPPPLPIAENDDVRNTSFMELLFFKLLCLPFCKSC